MCCSVLLTSRRDSVAENFNIGLAILKGSAEIKKIKIGHFFFFSGFVLSGPAGSRTKKIKNAGLDDQNVMGIDR